MSAQPFEGIKVVEFGQFVAVPIAAQLLAEGGAEVIHGTATQSGRGRLQAGSANPGIWRGFGKDTVSAGFHGQRN